MKQTYAYLNLPMATSEDSSHGINSTTPAPVIQGGGEMADRIRTLDWANTPLGPIEKWPLPLITTLNLILNSKSPLFLFWSRELYCFYNDAFRPSLGYDGKHPTLLGKPAVEFWPEAWPIIKPLTDQVLTTGESTWRQNEPVKIYRNARMENTFWTFAYSPIMDEQGKPQGVFVNCTETTHQFISQQDLIEREERLFFAIEAAQLGTWDYVPATNKFSGNDRLKEWFGLNREDEILLDYAVASIKDSDRERVIKAIQTALQFSSGGLYDIEYAIINPKTGVERRVRAVGKAWFNADKIAYRFNGTLQDITSLRK